MVPHCVKFGMVILCSVEYVQKPVIAARPPGPRIWLTVPPNTAPRHAVQRDMHMTAESHAKDDALEVIAKENEIFGACGIHPLL